MNAGIKIVRSCELVDSIWMQVEDLGNALSAMTESLLNDGQFKNLQSAGTSIKSYQHSTSGWSYTGLAISFPVMEKKRRKVAPSGWINYQVSVFGNGIPPVRRDGQERSGPVVHVSFWHLGTDYEDAGVYVKFPPSWDDWELKDSRLLFWDSEKQDQFPQWTFSIRLLELNSEDALRQSIIEPVQALLGGAQAAIALPAGLPGLIFYTSEDQGESVWNLTATEYDDQ